MDPARTLASVALLALAGPALAGTITVAPTGTPADFHDIADAVAAAAPGDTILVAAGQYVDATPLVVDKPLTILGQGSVSTSFRAVAQSPFDEPLPLLVTGLGLGEEVRIAGLSLSSQSLQGVPTAAVGVQDCLGPVVLADLANAAPLPNLPSPGLVQVRNSDQVTLSGCAFDAGGSVAATSPALLVDGSDVYVNDSRLVGARALVGFVTLPDDGAPALAAVGSEVRVARSVLLGGDGTGSSSFSAGTTATDGGSALVAEASQVYVRGGFGNQLRGGDGGLLQVTGATFVGAGGLAVEHDAASLVTTAADVFLFAGLDGLGQAPPAAVAGAGTWLPLATALATLEVAVPLVIPGQTVSVSHGGEPGALVLPYFALGQVDALPVPGIFGEILLDPAKAVALTPLQVSGIGVISGGVPVPPVPALVGLTALVQAFQVNPGGEASLSAAAFVGVR